MKQVKVGIIFNALFCFQTLNYVLILGIVVLQA